jgi:hypothetical protein
LLGYLYTSLLQKLEITAPFRQRLCTKALLKETRNH